MMLSFDLAILDWIQANLCNSVLDFVMPLVSKLGNGGMIWIAFALLLLIFPKSRRTGAAMFVSLGLEVVCCNLILKPLVGRIRPFEINKAVELLVPRPTDFSFPSGHTGASFAAAGALFFRGDRMWIPSCILAALIAFSRLYLYVHYPSDVLAGALLGIMAGWAGSVLSEHTRRILHAA